MVATLLTACGIVLLDYFLAYSTSLLEHFNLLSEPYSYRLTTYLRLTVAIVVLWKLQSAPANTGTVEQYCRRLSAQQRFAFFVLLSAAWVIAVLFAIAAAVNHNGFAIAPVLGLSDLVLLYPIVEEIVYRRIFLSALLSRLAILPAIAISVVVFVFLHIGPYGSGYDRADLAIWLLVGLITAICFVKTKSVVACILAHSMANALLMAWQLQFGRI
jgi:membrane protease YdiL (CAAX protease family)